MLDLIVVDGHARGIVTRNLVTGEVDVHIGDAVVLGTGGYGNVYYLSTNAKGSNVTAIWRAYKRGALFANPCFTQIHPTCIPVSGDYQSKLTLMSESLRNDGRIWVPKQKGDKRAPDEIPEAERDYYLERRYPSFGNLVPRDVASRNAKAVCDEGRGVGETGLASISISPTPSSASASKTIGERYGNLFEMYQRITDEDPYKVPMRIYPGHPLHHGRPLGGLQPAEHHPRPVRHRRSQLLRPRRQPPRRQRPDAGPVRRLLHHSLHHRQLHRDQQIRQGRASPRPKSQSSRRQRQCSSTNKLLDIKGKRTVDSFHRELGKIVWDYCGMSRTADRPRQAPSHRSANCATNSGRTSTSPAPATTSISRLEKAGRVADFFELAELMCIDALRPQRILRRPLPRGVSDSRWRSPARRRELLLRRRLGIPRARQAARCSRKNPLSSTTCIPARGATSKCKLTLKIWRQKNGRKDSGQVRQLSHGQYQPRHVLA